MQDVKRIGHVRSDTPPSDHAIRALHRAVRIGVDACHLWVLPSPLPFGLKNREAKT